MTPDFQKKKRHATKTHTTRSTIRLSRSQVVKHSKVKQPKSKAAFWHGGRVIMLRSRDYIEGRGSSSTMTAMWCPYRAARPQNRKVNFASFLPVLLHVSHVPGGGWSPVAGAVRNQWNRTRTLPKNTQLGHLWRLRVLAHWVYHHLVQYHTHRHCDHWKVCMCLTANPPKPRASFRLVTVSLFRQHCFSLCCLLDAHAWTAANVWTIASLSLSHTHTDEKGVCEKLKRSMPHLSNSFHSDPPQNAASFLKERRRTSESPLYKPFPKMKMENMSKYKISSLPLFSKSSPKKKATITWGDGSQDSSRWLYKSFFHLRVPSDYMEQKWPTWG